VAKELWSRGRDAVIAATRAAVEGLDVIIDRGKGSAAVVRQRCYPDINVVVNFDSKPGSGSPLDQSWLELGRRPSAMRRVGQFSRRLSAIWPS
jgi:hypothetical protein